VGQFVSIIAGSVMDVLFRDHKLGSGRVTAISALWQMFTPQWLVQSGRPVIRLTRGFSIAHDPLAIEENTLE
jgi:hypothetical protein